jgi:GNAT superfamily N-acetyltransferase/2'-5' RNA ligase
MAKQDKSYGWLGVDMPRDIALRMAMIQRMIDKHDLYEDKAGFGLEKHPHVTVAYGHEEDDPTNVREAIADIAAGEGTLGGLSVFDTNPDYKVLKLDVDSPYLQDLNARLRERIALPGLTFNKYNPHVTVAYLKKGADIEKYRKLERFLKGRKFPGKMIRFSNPRDQYRTILLPGVVGRPLSIAKQAADDKITYRKKPGSVRYKYDEGKPIPISTMNILALLNGRQIGKAQLMRNFHGKDIFRKMQVDKEHRGKGVAKELLRRLMEHADEEGIDTVYTRANPYNDEPLSREDLMKFYAKFGFEPSEQEGDELPGGGYPVGYGPGAMIRKKAEGKKRVTIIKGNPKYITGNKKAVAFYMDLKKRLEDEGYEVGFDAGEPYTTPSNDDYAWIGHSRGTDRLRFAPDTVRTLATGAPEKDWAVNHPDDVIGGKGNDPVDAHYTLTDDMFDRMKNILSKEAADLKEMLKDAVLTGSRGRARFYGRPEPEGRDYDYMIYEDDKNKREAIKKRLQEFAKSAPGFRYKDRPDRDGGTATSEHTDISVYTTRQRDMIRRAWELQEAGTPKDEAWAQVEKEFAKAGLPKTANLTKMAPKWSDREHLRAALREHLADATAAIDDDDKLDKEMTDLALISEAYKRSQLKKEQIRERLKKFQQYAASPSLAKTAADGPAYTLQDFYDDEAEKDEDGKALDSTYLDPKGIPTYVGFRTDNSALYPIVKRHGFDVAKYREPGFTGTPELTKDLYDHYNKTVVDPYIQRVFPTTWDKIPRNFRRGVRSLVKNIGPGTLGDPGEKPTGAIGYRKFNNALNAYVATGNIKHLREAMLEFGGDPSRALRARQLPDRVKKEVDMMKQDINAIETPKQKVPVSPETSAVPRSGLEKLAHMVTGDKSGRMLRALQMTQLMPIMGIPKNAAYDPSKEWVGVDLDGTLAKYTEWKGVQHIGEPIMPMVNRVKKWLEEGKNVKIFTARASNDNGLARYYVRQWCKEHIGRELPVTCVKDMHCTAIYDDKAKGVTKNRGKVKTMSKTAVLNKEAIIGTMMQGLKERWQSDVKKRETDYAASVAPEKYEGLNQSKRFKKDLKEQVDKIKAIVNGMGSPKNAMYEYYPDTLYGMDLTPVTDIHDYDYTYPMKFKDPEDALMHREKADLRFYDNMLRLIEKNSTPETRASGIDAKRRKAAKDYLKILQFLGPGTFDKVKKAQAEEERQRILATIPKAAADTSMLKTNPKTQIKSYQGLPLGVGPGWSPEGFVNPMDILRETYGDKAEQEAKKAAAWADKIKSPVNPGRNYLKNTPIPTKTNAATDTYHPYSSGAVEGFRTLMKMNPTQEEINIAREQYGRQATPLMSLTGKEGPVAGMEGRTRAMGYDPSQPNVASAKDTKGHEGAHAVVTPTYEIARDQKDWYAKQYGFPHASAPQSPPEGSKVLPPKAARAALVKMQAYKKQYAQLRAQYGNDPEKLKMINENEKQVDDAIVQIRQAALNTIKRKKFDEQGTYVEHSTQEMNPAMTAVQRDWWKRHGRRMETPEEWKKAFTDFGAMTPEKQEEFLKSLSSEEARRPFRYYQNMTPERREPYLKALMQEGPLHVRAQQPGFGQYMTS